MPRRKGEQTSESTPLDQLPIRPGYRRVRNLTQDVMSVTKLTLASPTGEIIFRCTSELTEGELPSQYAKGGKAPAYLVDVEAVQGEFSCTLACNAVLASALKRAGSPLIGRVFAVTVGDAVNGKRYRDTHVEELEEDE